MSMSHTGKSLEDLKREYGEIEEKLSDPELLSRPKELAELGKQLKELSAALRLREEETALQKELAETETLIAETTDADMRAVAQEEKTRIQERLSALTSQAIKEQAVRESAVVEIRPGAGGDEAALFAGQLARMYMKFAERSGWNVRILQASDTSLGGAKEAIFVVRGKGAYTKLSGELGVHRVQRIPETEKSGRIHTSTASVVVIPEAKETDLEVRSADIRIEFQRATGPGGQNVNKRETAVRLTHIPSGIVVTSQEERTQQSNKEIALSVLRSRLLAMKKEEEAKLKSELRKSQIGSGDRSDKIRTYNFPQDRVTDHRIKESWHNINGIMEGNIDAIVEALSAHHEE